MEHHMADPSNRTGDPLAPTSNKPGSIDAWIAEARQQEEQLKERQREAAAREPLLRCRASLTQTFHDKLPGLHQTKYPEQGDISAGRHDEIAVAFIDLLAGLDGEALASLRDAVRECDDGNECREVARSLFRLAGEGKRDVLVALIGQLAQAPPWRQQEVYKEAKHLTEAVVPQSGWGEIGLQAGMPQPQSRPRQRPASPAEKAGARGQTDTKTDTKKKKRPAKPRDVARLIGIRKAVEKGRKAGKSMIECAREFTEGNEKKAQSILRLYRRHQADKTAE
jgi:hypothetical protein